MCDASKDAKGNPIVMAVGHQRHYSILYDNAVEQIRQGLIGDIHHIRAQWHRDNSPGHDSWSPPLPGDRRALEKELAAWQKLMAGPDRPSDANGNRRMGSEDRAEAGADQRHHGRAGAEVRLRSQDDRRLQPACAGRIDSLAVVESHGGWFDGGAGQPSTRCGEHLHFGYEQKNVGSTCIRWRFRRWAGGRSSRTIASARTTCIACSSSPARATTRETTRTRWPTRTRRSWSRTRRSTATASADTAKSCSAPTAR